jgi:5-methylcytosine-specific restriction endonuclease McrA
MQTLALLSKDQLLEQIKVAAAEERQATLLLIEYLKEVERRLLYCELGYSSLWSFGVEYLGLSEGACQRRISTMRLAAEIPEVKLSIEEGRLSLSNATQLQSHFQNEKKKGNASTIEQKKELIHKMEGLSKAECERELLKLSPEALPKDRERPLTDTHTELRFVVDQAVMEDMEKLKGLMAQQFEQITLSELFSYLLKQELKQQEKKKVGSERQTEKSEQIIPMTADTSQAELPPPVAVAKSSRYIPTAIRRRVWKRAGGRCEFVSAEGKRCASQYRLEFHHKIPFALGGEHSETNVFCVCRSHNVAAAVTDYGRSTMKRWMSRI